MMSKNLLFSLLIISLLFNFPSVRGNRAVADADDNEFAEFEEFEDDKAASEEKKSTDEKEEQLQPNTKSKQLDDNEDEASIETEEADEFEHFTDEEEFEGFDQDRVKAKEPVDLKITNVPRHLYTSYESYFFEIITLLGISAYALNYFFGRHKNYQLATAWWNSHKQLLDTNFSLVGDDGQGKEMNEGILMKEAEHVYSLWCSGRRCCEGMLVQLKFIKRQDLINSIIRLSKPMSDQLVYTVQMEDMDKFVFVVAQKKTGAMLYRDMNDVAQYCQPRKTVDKYSIPSQLSILYESEETISAMLDSKVCSMLNKTPQLIEYIHVSDQYTGSRVVEQDKNAQPDAPTSVQKVLIVCFNVSERGRTSKQDMEKTTQCTNLVFHLMDRVRHFALSREGRDKAVDNRRRIDEALQKTLHQQRQEAAQQRREDKRREEKEKLLTIDDPDRARKLEDKERKRELKRKQPKMKQMKIKAL